MALLSPFSYIQWFDDSGSPLAYGKIYTYYAGSSTPKTTYTDGTGVTPHTNPVILDSSGRAQIWLDSGAYKFIVYTSADVLVETIDNIVGSQVTINVGYAATIAALKALSEAAYSIVMVGGYTSFNDGGEGTFVWDATNGSTDDTGTVIIPNSAPTLGRWVRQITNNLYSPKMFATVNDFFTWATAQITTKTVAITRNLDLGATTKTLSSYIDIILFNNGATISNGTLTIGKMSARPEYKIFADDLTVSFSAGATRYANMTWFGSGSSGLTRLTTAFPDGNIKFEYDAADTEKNKLKFLGSDDVVYDYALFNPIDTW